MARWIRYFAYGSNMHPARLRERTPSCRRVGVASLAGYTLRFNQRSTGDGSAKCNIETSPGERVLGVVFDLLAVERPSLDRAEDLGRGYLLQELEVLVDGSREPVSCYVAAPGAVSEGIRPFRWYRDIVLHGARQHRFPEQYLARIAATPVIEDPDRTRNSRHLQLLTVDEPLPAAVTGNQWPGRQPF